MAKLTKREIKSHIKACEILEKDVLSEDDKEFVLDNWFPYAENNVASESAFFTPKDLAREAAIFISINIPDNKQKFKLLDLCAGIGILSLMVKEQMAWGKEVEITAVEYNSDFVRVGKKLLPDAKWINMDAFDEESWKKNGIENERFDLTISNPPFGLKGKYEWRGYNGPADLVACAVALDKTNNSGIFILPQGSVPFLYSGQNFYQKSESKIWNKFKKYYPDAQLDCISVDTSIYKTMWNQVNPSVELVQIYDEPTENEE